MSVGKGASLAGTPADDEGWMRLALRLARRGYGTTSPNPMVGAVLVRDRRVIGQGWHRRAGQPHAEIEALRDARARGHSVAGASLYVTLEPCSTQGRTPPCTDAILQAQLRRVVVGAQDPNPRHHGRAFPLLERAGLVVTRGILAEACERLNPAFNHWIVHHVPWVTVKAAMTLDGKIATPGGQSKWITDQSARLYGMKLRLAADAILVGIHTVLADDPSLTVRPGPGSQPLPQRARRIVLDSMARTPLHAKLVADEHAGLTTIVVGESAPQKRVAALARRVRILVAPAVSTVRKNAVSASGGQRGPKTAKSRDIDLAWLLHKLGSESVLSLLVEGGGEVNASFLLGGFAHRVAFFYAPKILGGRDARRAVAGIGALALSQTLDLNEIRWRKLGPDWLLTASVAPHRGEPG